MERFSERMGFKPVREVLQKDSMDDELRNRLWNALTGYYLNRYPQNTKEKSYFYKFYNSLCDRYFKTPLDMSGWNYNEIYTKIRDYFFDCKWYETYDFIEFIVANYPPEKNSAKFIHYCNSILEEELSGYRFIGKRITPITSDQEISEIEDALYVPLKPVQDHLKRSLELLSNREDPDYRNSIKESISAVESMCMIMTGDSNIRNALNKIRKDCSLHDNLKTAFQNLYNYTSASSGIRHAMTSDPNVGQEEAKFMLVTCSAFVNFLLAKASKAGMDLTAASSN